MRMGCQSGSAAALLVGADVVAPWKDIHDANRLVHRFLLGRQMGGSWLFRWFIPAGVTR